MDLTKLFLGDALEGMDLGGLNKLGFKMMDGFGNDDGEETKERTRDRDLFSDSDVASEEEKEKEEEEADYGLPPTLYGLAGDSKVYELSSLFVPGKSKASNKIREKMLLFNKAIIN